MFNLIKNLHNHLKVTISAWAARGIIAITNLIAIKFLLQYLGIDGYATYVILLSFTSWCALTDFGIGFSLQNYISELRIKKQDYQPYINSAFQIILCFTFTALVLSFILYNPIQKIILKKYFYLLQTQSINIVLTTLFLLIIIGFVNISIKIYYAFQKGVIPNILISLAYIISFCSMLVIVNTQSEINKILKIILCYTLPQILLLGFLFVKIFKGSITDIFQINKEILKHLFIRSLKFGGLTIMGLFVYEIEYFVMAQTLNSSDIAVYSVFMKLFFAFFNIYLSLLYAFWPLSTELFYSKKYIVLKYYIRKYLLFGIALLFVIITISFICKSFVFRFLLPNITYDLPITFFLLSILYFIIRIISDTYALILKSINVLKIFFIYQPIQLIINIFLQYYFSLKYGINGIILGLLLSFLVTCCLLLPYKVYTILNK